MRSALTGGLPRTGAVGTLTAVACRLDGSFALGAIAEAAETALAEQSGAETIEIVVSPFIGNAEGMYGFRVTLDREQREQFNL